MERFYADWPASSAGRLSNHLFDHWAIRLMDYDDGRGQGRQLHGVPVWLTTRSLPKIETMSKPTAFALMDRLQRFDEKVGCACAWYFFILHGNRIAQSVGETVAEAVEDGIITLPNWDRDVLRSWKDAPLFILTRSGRRSDHELSSGRFPVSKPIGVPRLDGFGPHPS